MDTRPTADQVQRLLDAAEAGSAQLFMSMINVGEVFYMLVKRRSRADRIIGYPTRTVSRLPRRSA